MYPIHQMYRNTVFENPIQKSNFVKLRTKRDLNFRAEILEKREIVHHNNDLNFRVKTENQSV